MKRFTFLICAAAAMALSSAAFGAEKCAVKIKSSTGELEVKAANVAANPKWGTSLSNATATFTNQGTCYDPVKLKLTKCALGSSGSLASTMPPANCTVCVVDDGPNDCCGFAKGCTPGLRLRDASFAVDDPRIEAMEAPDDSTLRFSSVNVQVVDGTGDTGGAPNGTGNVIVGYNEPRGFGPVIRTGSHNLIVGHAHNWSGYGGIAVGGGNSLSGWGASITAMYSTADGLASVPGGGSNTALGNASSISGGIGNTTDSDSSSASVSAGYGNQVSGDYSSISGGWYNIVSGSFSSVSGGYANENEGNYSTISGGRSNEIGDSADYGVIAGGRDNSIEGDTAVILGGRNNSIVFSYGGGNTIGGGNGVAVGGGGETLEWHASQNGVGGFPTGTRY